MIYEDVTHLIGNTPTISLSKLIGDPRVELFGKMEMSNPGGSVKDRAALGMIRAAENSGQLGPGVTIVEPSSGNTGISLAMVAATRGYKMIVTMPETMTAERKAIMEYFGAEVILTAGDEGMNGAIWEAERLAERENSLMLSQFTNPANPDFHASTTGPEIVADFGDTLDYFVAGVGTGGTITGAGRILKRDCHGIKIVAVEPVDSPVLSGGEAGSHDIPGLGPGFVSEIMDLDLLDDIVSVESDESYAMSQRLGRELGILAGISAGASVAAALRIAESQLALAPRDYEKEPLKLLCILPDTGERYMSILADR